MADGSNPTNQKPELFVFICANDHDFHKSNGQESYDEAVPANHVVILLSVIIMTALLLTFFPSDSLPLLTKVNKS